MDRGGDLWGPKNKLTGALSASEVMVVKGAAKAALAVNTGIAESGGSSSDMFVAPLERKVTATPA